jgi:glycosyltransferase involved in cell wall biosynthesis
MVLAHAARLAEDGHDVVLKTRRLDTVFRVDAGIRTEEIALGGVAGTICAAALEHSPGAVYVADIAALAFLLSLRNSGRVLFFAQGYDEYNCASLPGRLLIRLLLFLVLRVMRVPVFTVSDHLADFLRLKYGAEARVVPNGIDPAFFAPLPTGNPYLSLKQGREVILMHARLDYAKGFDTAQVVLRQVAARSSLPVEVWTVGEEVRLDFVPHRHFGYVSGDELAQLMSAADLFFHPSRHEGFALIVLEAFARRCPVVTTQAVSFALDGENALVAEVDDEETLVLHLLRLLDDAGLRASLSDRGYLSAAESSLARSSQQFLDAFAERFGVGKRWD